MILGYATNTLYSSDSDDDAMHCQMELLLAVGKILENNRSLTERLARYEQQLFPDNARTLQQSGIPRATYDAQLCRPRKAFKPRYQRSSSAHEQRPSHQWVSSALRENLSSPNRTRKSKAIEWIIHSKALFLGSHAWTALSDISMAEISAISVVALPIDWSDITNAYHYPRPRKDNASRHERSITQPETQGQSLEAIQHCSPWRLRS
jgi:hypothetical protein